MAVMFRTCHAVAASTVYGENGQWDRFHDEVDDIVPLAVRRFHITKVMLSHMKMSHGWKSIRPKI